MRWSEIDALPATPSEAKNTVMDIMAVYKSNNRTEIPVNAIMRTLHRQGYDIDRRLLSDLLKDEPWIKRISADTIFLDTGELEPEMISPDQGQRNKEKVKQMAQSAIDIGE